ncbi:hypothetical protein GDO81_028114 [Engystomops pustulosus]|uniref:Uncharacterized protein n=1 Tax=Engystomops pustulosus TaxID=76066 RepID=A0AAV6ZGW8_ENGPU|nr:hypothetical protein GDO81_028114 [Engystomops pustulosus]
MCSAGHWLQIYNQYPPEMKMSCKSAHLALYRSAIMWVTTSGYVPTTRAPSPAGCRVSTTGSASCICSAISACSTTAPAAPPAPHAHHYAWPSTYGYESAITQMCQATARDPPLVHLQEI